MLDPVNKLGMALTREARAKRHHLVKCRPQRVNVAPGVREAVESLRGHEPQCPDQVMRVREVFRLFELCQSEVGDPDVSQPVEDQVRRLDIAMEHAWLVGIGERVGDLCAKPGDLARAAQFALRRKGAARAGERRLLATRAVVRTGHLPGRRRGFVVGACELRREHPKRRPLECFLRVVIGRTRNPPFLIRHGRGCGGLRLVVVRAACRCTDGPLTGHQAE